MDLTQVTIRFDLDTVGGKVGESNIQKGGLFADKKGQVKIYDVDENV